MSETARARPRAVNFIAAPGILTKSEARHPRTRPLPQQARGWMMMLQLPSRVHRKCHQFSLRRLIRAQDCLGGELCASGRVRAYSPLDKQDRHPVIGC